jgi:hypothetical protein
MLSNINMLALLFTGFTFFFGKLTTKDILPDVLDKVPEIVMY